VWLNDGLAERPLTPACFILDADDSIPALLEWNIREGLTFQHGGGAVGCDDPRRRSLTGGIQRPGAPRAGVADSPQHGYGRGGSTDATTDSGSLDHAPTNEALCRQADPGS